MVGELLGDLHPEVVAREPDVLPRRRGGCLCRTQFGEDDEFGKIPPEMMLEFNGYEQFVQVYPEPDGALRANWASSLFP